MRLRRAVDLFDVKLAEDGRTKATRLKYVRDVLYPFCKQFDGETTVAQPSRDQCRLFLGRWANSAPATRALHVSVLSVFFAFCIDNVNTVFALAIVLSFVPAIVTWVVGVIDARKVTPKPSSRKPSR